MAIKIEVGGARTEITPKKGAKSRFTLEELREAIGGGYAERHPILGKTTKDWPYVVAYFDEDGRIKGQEINESASQIAGFPLVGTVLFCRRSEG